MMLSWSPPDTTGSSPLTRYAVFRGDIIVCCDTADSLMTEDVGLLPNTEYTYRVRAWNENGVGQRSSAAAVTTARAPPPKPAYPLLAGSGVDWLHLEWDVDGTTAAQLVAQKLVVRLSILMPACLSVCLSVLEFGVACAFDCILGPHTHA